MGKFEALVSRFIQNYTHTQWTSTIQKIKIYKGGSFFNLIQQPGDQCRVHIMLKPGIRIRQITK